MSAAPLPEARSKGVAAVLRLLRFAAIGLGATILYAILALLFESALTVDAVTASVLAYGLAAAFSYFGHKLFTFASAGDHQKEAPRFIATALAGLVIAAATPTIFTHMLALPSWIAVGATCVVIPLANLLVLEKWVFANR
jgi:putative flippase GtrA